MAPLVTICYSPERIDSRRLFVYVEAGLVRQPPNEVKHLRTRRELLRRAGQDRSNCGMADLAALGQVTQARPTGEVVQLDQGIAEVIQGSRRHVGTMQTRHAPPPSPVMFAGSVTREVDHRLASRFDLREPRWQTGDKPARRRCWAPAEAS
jgi:hypothetical protein